MINRSNESFRFGSVKGEKGTEFRFGSGKSEKRIESIDEEKKINIKEDSL